MKTLNDRFAGLGVKFRTLKIYYFRGIMGLFSTLNFLNNIIYRYITIV